MNKGLGPKIKSLREEGKGYRQIAKELNCSRSTVAYHISSEQKEKSRLRQNEYRKNNPIARKVCDFINRKTISQQTHISKTSLKFRLYHKILRFSERDTSKVMFTVEELIDKIGDNPRCYLTGKPIDLEKTTSYHLDHIIPSSRGGDNSLDNCGLACSQANCSKNDMTFDEFIEFCKSVLEWNGYRVEELN